MKYFNTAGPCDPAKHYMVSPDTRLPDARRLVERESYFVVHAPRQTGKSTALRSLAWALTAEGRWCALYFSCEAAEPWDEDIEAAEAVVLDAIERAARLDLPAELLPPTRPEAAPGSRLGALLSSWALSCPRPLVLFFDEIDALRGASLLSVLRQLRAGFPSRPKGFPASVVLCGLRDVRDYKAASGGDPERLGTSSPFNIKVASLRVADFTEAELRDLYAQHTVETGQRFEDAAQALAWELTQGQPWLTNALAAEIVDQMRVPPNDAITAAHVDTAKERLILARQTHLDSLVARLMEPRVRRVIEPLLAGDTVGGGAFDDDFSYVRDLGLVANDKAVRIANPIYREVIVRVLAVAGEANVVVEPRRFVLPDGRLDLGLLLREFVAFWKEHGDVLAGKMPYHEVAPQLVFMAFLQRVVNGGGYVDREYGVGRGRIDLLVRWPQQREAIELKVWAPGKPDPLARGLDQLDEYLTRLGLDHGTLVLFDRREEAPAWAERGTFETVSSRQGRTVTVLRV